MWGKRRISKRTPGHSIEPNRNWALRVNNEGDTSKIQWVKMTGRVEIVIFKYQNLLIHPRVLYSFTSCWFHFIQGIRPCLGLANAFEYSHPDESYMLEKTSSGICVDNRKALGRSSQSGPNLWVICILLRG